MIVAENTFSGSDQKFKIQLNLVGWEKNIQLMFEQVTNQFY